MEHMRGEWLVTFAAVVEARSFTGAAKRLHRTQSAISMQIQQLEAAAGMPLLVRERAGVIPTEAGERLLPHARRTADALRDAAAMFNSDEMASGPLRIGIPEEYSGSELPQLLSHFQRSQPSVELLVQSASSDRLAAAIEEDALDLALLVADDNERHSGEVLLYDPTWWVVADNINLPTTGPLPLVLFDQACWWRQCALNQVNETGREWRITYTSDSIAGVAAAIQAGLGIGVLGKSTIPKGIRAVPKELKLPNLPGSQLILQRKSPDAPGTQDMVALMRRHFSV
ncbi:LysR family transcriptional regulator [Chromohalobacter sarecensis]|uniref:LysR family transcriptional regulator n=1 Tax=Chromohalobacter sarecensis TaxID=245294 RepID=A0ABV9CZF0_9GAMM|nr:LysR family transcriptional regulator [Chromohalobacter sarecensis]MCK0713857.1 LysR family transcriptional regulator [Chromohalobacter sarecensis]